ncbi:thioredoxin family protein [Providencia sp.]
MSNILLLDSDNFSRTLYQPEQRRGRVVIVYFSASWCVPCQNMQPVFEKLANYYVAEGAHFATVNIAQSPTLAPKYGIKSVPTIAIFKDARLINIIAGEVSFYDAMKVFKPILEGN